MAARENQGYLIAVIILVLLTLVLALVAFLGVQKAYEQAEAAEASDGKLRVALEIAKAEGLKGEALKAVIGDLGPAPAEIDNTINDLQGLSGSSDLTAADKKIIEDILSEVRKAKEVYDLETGRNISDGDDASKVATLLSRIADLTALVDRLRNNYITEGRRATEAADDAAAEIAAAKSALASVNEKLGALSKELDEAKSRALKDQDKFKAEVDMAAEKIADLTRTSQEAASIAAAAIRNANEQVEVLVVENSNLKKTLNELTTEVFERADGKVIHVAAGLRTVFIDIGRDDGLTSNQTFTVYDQSVTDFENATPKATVEVIRVQPFRSEARITKDETVNPILPGDHVLTATWDPGFTVKFALAGRFDLDGDRFDDTEKLIRMIERNGGEVVCSHDLQGNITGEISSDVRYLVKGNTGLIGGTEDDPDAGQILNAVEAMEGDADKNTVQVIDLQKLLNRMGVRAQPKTKQLDFPQGGFHRREAGGSATRHPAGSGTTGSDTRQPAGSASR